jgi:hypothetical protein
MEKELSEDLKEDDATSVNSRNGSWWPSPCSRERRWRRERMIKSRKRRERETRKKRK